VRVAYFEERLTGRHDRLALAAAGQHHAVDRGADRDRVVTGSVGVAEVQQARSRAGEPVRGALHRVLASAQALDCAQLAELRLVELLLGRNALVGEAPRPRAVALRKAELGLGLGALVPGTLELSLEGPHLLL
jgi:hypothetical protein